MKTITTLATATAFIVLSLNAFASKTSDKEPVKIKAWGFVFGSMPVISTKRNTVTLPEFVFGNDQDINTEEIEALKMLAHLFCPR